MTDVDVERLAVLAGLPIAAEERASVAAMLEILVTGFERLQEFALSEDVHPAPVFRP